MDSTANRRATGRVNEASRRASGRSIMSDLRALQEANSRERTLSALPARGSQASTRGTGTWSESRMPSTGGGIDSPLTEQDFTARTYWPDKVIQSTDGVFSFKIKPIKSIRQVDANGAEVIQQFAQPVEPSHA
ncbi:hypothetical protein BWR15_06220 [Pseudomonas sp. T]|nr:hypothetical protein BWR15_06220 [Pseudomonas sp. T]